jgi:predicted ferric reductase
MHLTKRFGIVAASQLPMHFLLAMKSSYSPLQILTRMSHEQLNSAHRVLGKVIQALLTLHAAFYLNFFARVNVLAKRIKDRDVVLGIACIWIITIISSSAVAVVRKWNYRLFYSLHVILATVFLPIAYFHVHHLRKYILESAAVYVVFGVLRLVNTKLYQGNITLVPGTSLVQVKIPLASSFSGYRPGQHVYLSLPAGGKSDISNILQRNPFTVASLPQQDRQLLLVARVLNGNTKRFAALAQHTNVEDRTVAQSLGLKIDGPYGAAAHLPNFAQFDRVLLVAGGVGATFIIPIWRSIIALHRSKDLSSKPEVKLVWAVRSLAETKWAIPIPEDDFRRSFDSSETDVEIYVTGNAASSGGGPSTRESLELEDLVADDDRPSLGIGIATMYQRPNLRQIILETCDRRGDRVAVLVCGPASMWRQLRHEVRRQVIRSNDVYFHAEEFGL